MQYTLRGEPFELNEKNFMDIYDEGIRYFYEEVIGLYTDTIINDPIEGIQLAFGDFLTNDSPLQDEEGEYISWDDAIALGKEIYDLSGLDEKTKKIGPVQLKPLSKTKKNPKQNGIHEISDWLQTIIDDGSPENAKYLVFDKDDGLFRKLLKKVDEVDLDTATMDRISDKYWNEWYSVRNGIMQELADEVLKEKEA